MRKSAPLVLMIWCLLSLTAFGQGSLERACAQNYCSFNGADIEIVPLQQFASDEEARQVMNRILRVLGLQSNFNIQAADVPNAAAVVNGSIRHIFYNPRFIQSVERSTRTDWSSISILAHEIGHHLNGHTLTRQGSRPKTELEADRFSGFVLRKMGASLSEAQAAVRVLSNPQGSFTHPPRNERLLAIEDGWLEADAQMGAYQQPVSGRGGARNHHDSSPRPEFARWEIKLQRNPKSLYYITKENEFVVLKGQRKFTLGSLQAVNNPSYPYVIKLEHSPDIMVSKEGQLYSMSGKVLGEVRKR